MVPRHLIRFNQRERFGALLLFLTVLFNGTSGHGQRRPLASSHDTQANCQLQSGGESTVLAVVGPQTLHLADGRFVRLAEILVPSSAFSGQGFDPSLAATSYLRKTAVGQKVEVKFGGTQRDRYGIYIAHLYLAGEPRVWLQEGLVNSGFAEVLPQDDNHACSQRLLALEEKARNEQRGHWSLALFKVLHARDPRSILNLVQTYQIVEGKVDHASESGGRVTLHFGAENKYGFIAIIEPSAKKRFADKKASGDWTSLSVRVRGWVERRRGPAVSVTQSEQIEFLQQDSSDAKLLKEGQ